jgi:tRNA threonylcarbamoyladenosine biosynthesis protein TsaE
VRNGIEIVSRSPEQTRKLGRALGEILRGGEFIELCGPLGAGKTQVAKGLALGLGVPEEEVVVSPTFVLVREYVGRLRFYHCDGYRLRTVDELRALGVEEMLDGPNSVVAFEWADRFPGALDAETFRVQLDHIGGAPESSLRRIRITAPTESRAAALARRLRRMVHNVPSSPG